MVVDLPVMYGIPLISSGITNEPAIDYFDSSALLRFENVSSLYDDRSHPARHGIMDDSNNDIIQQTPKNHGWKHGSSTVRVV